MVFAVTKDRVATMGVDVLLTTGRTAPAGSGRVRQSLLGRLQTGLPADAVEVREITPPPDVLDAFKDVSRHEATARRWLWQRKHTRQSVCLRFGVSLRKRSRDFEDPAGIALRRLRVTSVASRSSSRPSGGPRAIRARSGWTPRAQLASALR